MKLRELLCPKCTHGCLLRVLANSPSTDSMHFIRSFVQRRGSLLFDQGDPVLGCYQLCSGRAKFSYRTLGGKRWSLLLLGAGDLAGASEVLSNARRHSGYVEILEEARLLLFEKREFLNLLGRSSAFTLEVARKLALKNLALRAKFINLFQGGVKHKITALLLDLSHSGLLQLKLSNCDIAELVGSTLETVSLTLCMFSKRGLISRDHGQLQILDPNGLWKLVEGPALMGF